MTIQPGSERASRCSRRQATERRLAVIETQQRIARDVHDLLGTVSPSSPCRPRAPGYPQPPIRPPPTGPWPSSERPPPLRRRRCMPWSTCCRSDRYRRCGRGPGRPTDGAGGRLPALLRPGRLAPEPERRRQDSTWSFCATVRQAQQAGLPRHPGGPTRPAGCPGSGAGPLRRWSGVADQRAAPRSSVRPRSLAAHRGGARHRRERPGPRCWQEMRTRCRTDDPHREDRVNRTPCQGRPAHASATSRPAVSVSEGLGGGFGLIGMRDRVCPGRRHLHRQVPRLRADGG